MKKTKNFSQHVGGVLENAFATEPDTELLEEPTPSRKSRAGGVKVLSALSDEEAARLVGLEATIERGLTTFMEVGSALVEIQDNKLYRATSLSFEQYMMDRFNLNRARGYQLIEAAKVVNQIAEELKLDPAGESTGAEGYEAVPTGKVRRPKAGLSRPQPQDVDFTEEFNGLPSSQEQPDEQGLLDEEGDTDESVAPTNTMDKTIPLPATESHAAALAQFPEENRTQIWKETVAESEQDGKPITASRIKKTAEKGGVSLNKKAPKDRKPSTNAFGRNADADDDFSEEAVEHTRQAMEGLNWLPPSTATTEPDSLVDQADNELGGEGSDKPISEAPVGSRQALVDQLRGKISRSQPGEVIITLKGSFLIREKLVKTWQTLRGDDRPIDNEYSDTVTIQEFYELVDINLE